MLDRMDRKILEILQEDCTLPVAEIGKRIGLSTTPCWRRIQKLEEQGVIERRVALHWGLPGSQQLSWAAKNPVDGFDAVFVDDASSRRARSPLNRTVISRVF